MRHTEKIEQRWFTWNAIDCTFDATVYRAKLDSLQTTVVVNQWNDDLSTDKRWRKSFRGKTVLEADTLADDYIDYVKKNSIEAEEVYRNVDSI